MVTKNVTGHGHVFHPHFPTFFLIKRNFPGKKRGRDPSRFLSPYSCPIEFFLLLLLLLVQSCSRHASQVGNKRERVGHAII